MEINYEDEFIRCADDPLERKAYIDLARYIRFLAGTYQIFDHWALSQDDLTGEGFYALAKALKMYRSQLENTYDEFTYIAKRCIKNAMIDARRKILSTRRKAELYAPSLDDFDQHQDEISDGGRASALFNETDQHALLNAEIDASVDPAEYAESVEVLTELLQKLSPLERRVLGALLGFGDNHRVISYVELVSIRRKWIGKGGSLVTVDPYVVSRAICEPLADVKKAFTHIGVLIREVWNESD